METVGQFDQDYPGIVRKCKQDFFKVFRLLRGVDIYYVLNFGQSVDNSGNLTSEVPFYIFQSDISIFDHIV